MAYRVCEKATQDVICEVTETEMKENRDNGAVQTGPRMLGAGVPKSYRPTQDTSYTLLCTKTRGAHGRQEAAFRESKALLAQLQTAFQQVY